MTFRVKGQGQIYWICVLPLVTIYFSFIFDQGRKHFAQLLPDVKRNSPSYVPQREKTFFGGLQATQAQTSLLISAFVICFM